MVSLKFKKQIKCLQKLLFLQGQSDKDRRICQTTKWDAPHTHNYSSSFPSFHMYKGISFNNIKLIWHLAICSCGTFNEHTSFLRNLFKDIDNKHASCYKKVLKVTDKYD